MSRLHVHRGFIQLLKLWLNLCSFRWLNPSRSLVINLSLNGSKMQNIGLGMGWIIFIKLALKILKLYVSILKLSLFHLFIIPGIYSSTNWPPVYQSQIGILKLSFETLNPLNKKIKKYWKLFRLLEKSLSYSFFAFRSHQRCKKSVQKEKLQSREQYMYAADLFFCHISFE